MGTDPARSWSQAGGLLAGSLLAGCVGPAQPASSLQLTGPVLPEGSAGSTGETDGSTGGPSGDESTSEPAAVDSTGGSSGPLQDVGGMPDLGPLAPPGCKGKIDFLFLVSRAPTMQTAQQRIVDAFADFHATIAAKFADFDYHIMVVDGDAEWGDWTCNETCTPEGCPWPEFPCHLLDDVTVCDDTMGAGTIMNGGEFASNKWCGVVGGRRYLTRDQPNLAETFACVAQVGTNGYQALGAALTAAVSPEMNGPGGCNQGFLRGDALLMVTFVMGGIDPYSEGTAEAWAQKVIAAKHGDPRSVVMFGLFAPNCVDDKQDRLCQMVQMFPYWQVESNLVEDYGPAFDSATDMVAQACSEFIPQ